MYNYYEVVQELTELNTAFSNFRILFIGVSVFILGFCLLSYKRSLKND